MATAVSRLRTPLTDLLGVDAPVVQAPMAGGPGTPRLAAAVSEAGGLGSLAGGYLSADGLAAEIDAVRRATGRPFAVNLFAGPVMAPDPRDVDAAVAVVNRLRAELDLPPLSADIATSTATGVHDTATKIDLLVALAAPVVSFTFGPPAAGTVQRLHDARAVVIGTATTVDEAVHLRTIGVDVICAQSVEAGAHSGAADPTVAPSLGGMALVPQVVDATGLPVLAAGAVMDGRGLAAALALGAAGAQCGTAFLRASEAGTADAHREAIATATDRSTTLTRGITGRYARGITNRIVDVLREVDVPDFPVMHALTSELRQAATRHDQPDLMALWAGQGAPLARAAPAGDIVRRMVDEAARILQHLAARAD